MFWRTEISHTSNGIRVENLPARGLATIPTTVVPIYVPVLSQICSQVSGIRSLPTEIFNGHMAYDIAKGYGSEDSLLNVLSGNPFRV